MKNKRLSLIAIAAVVTSATISASVYATEIVFDPTNYGKAVEQVTQNTRLLQQLQQQLQNQLKMIQNWGFSQLGGILGGMQSLQAVFATSASFSAQDAASQMNQQFPHLPESYNGTTDAQIQSQRQQWDQAERQALIDTRNIQNRVYQEFQPTAQRMDQYVEQSNNAPGVTAAVQAGNEELAAVVAQVQALQSQEIADARIDAESAARQQAEEAYAEEQRQKVRAHWNNPPRPTGQLMDPFPLAQQ